MDAYDPRAAASAVATAPAKEHILAPAREWRTTLGVGKAALTVEPVEGKAPRQFLTFAPSGAGKDQRTPLLAVYGPLDAGDLDGGGCVWLTTRDGALVDARDEIYVLAADAAVDLKLAVDTAVSAALKVEREAVKAKAEKLPKK